MQAASSRPLIPMSAGTLSVALLLAMSAPVLAKDGRTGLICLDTCSDRKDSCQRKKSDAVCSEAFHACRLKCFHMPARRVPRPQT